MVGQLGISALLSNNKCVDPFMRDLFKRGRFPSPVELNISQDPCERLVSTVIHLAMQTSPHGSPYGMPHGRNPICIDCIIEGVARSLVSPQNMLQGKYCVPFTGAHVGLCGGFIYKSGCH